MKGFMCIAHKIGVMSREFILYYMVFILFLMCSRSVCFLFFFFAKSFDSLNVDDHQQNRIRIFKCMNSVFADFFLLLHSLLICDTINSCHLGEMYSPLHIRDDRKQRKDGEKREDTQRDEKNCFADELIAADHAYLLMACQNEWVNIKRPKFDEWKEIHFSFCQLVSAHLLKKTYFRSIGVGILHDCTIFFFC